MILTEMLSSPLCQDVLSNDCIKATEKFQCSMIEKETYLAFYVRKTISMSFDAMTTPPVKSTNTSINNGMGVTSNSNTRWVGRSLHIIHKFIYYMNLCIFLHIIHEFVYYMNLYFIQIHVMTLFPCFLCSLYICVIALYSSNTLMKLEKGSIRRITSFENAAQAITEILLEFKIEYSWWYCQWMPLHLQSKIWRKSAF